MLTLFTVLFCLATYRVTRLIVEDDFPPSKTFRNWVIDRWGWESWQGYLVYCPWCVSMYVSAGLVATVAPFVKTHPVHLFLLWFAASATTGILSTVVNRIDGDED